MSDTIKGGLFDLDGTLLDTLEDIAVCMNRILKRHGFPRHDAGSYRMFVGDGVEMLVRRAVAPSDDEKKIARCASEFRRQYHHGWNRATRPYDGITVMLETLQSLRLFLAVLSNKPNRTTIDMVRYYFPGQHFTVCMGHGAFPRKPDPQAALYIASVMGIKPQECLYAGDSGTDMETAAAANMPSLGVLWGFREESELRQKGAGWIAAAPGEVVKIISSVNKVSLPTDLRIDGGA